MAPSDERLWGYASLARLWSWTLIAVAGVLLAFAMALEAGYGEGLTSRWFATLIGITGVTGVISFPFFRVWLSRSALPSVRLHQAVRATGPRRLEATPRDWRRWGLFTVAILLVGGAAMMMFLIGVLGRGGTAEGVVVGMLAAWGAATLVDVGRIREMEAVEGRRYYAACRRPTGCANHLAWLPRRDPAPAAASPPSSPSAGSALLAFFFSLSEIKTGSPVAVLYL